MENSVPVTVATKIYIQEEFAFMKIAEA